MNKKLKKILSILFIVLSILVAFIIALWKPLKDGE